MDTKIIIGIVAVVLISSSITSGIYFFNKNKDDEYE